MWVCSFVIVLTPHHSPVGPEENEDCQRRECGESAHESDDWDEYHQRPDRNRLRDFASAHL